MTEEQRRYEGAISIAQEILATDVEFRGNLFLEVSILLRKYSQYSTAHHIEELAHTYGIKA